jgi:hypothetical protein
MKCTVDHQKMNRNYCTQCGAAASASPSYSITPDNFQTNPNQSYGSQPTNGLAIAGFVLSMLGCGFPVGLILSAVALGQFNKNPNQKGKGLAIAGLVVSIASIFFFILYFAVIAASSGY